MTYGTQLHIFAEGVKPMWEDSQCAPGGKWSIRNTPKTHTNKFWEDLALALIGDMFSDENEVLGILVNLRPNSDQLQIWQRSGKDQKKINTLKGDLENALKLQEHELKEKGGSSSLIIKVSKDMALTSKEAPISVVAVAEGFDN